MKVLRCTKHDWHRLAGTFDILREIRFDAECDDNRH